MLDLLFQIGGKTCLLDSRQVEEVTPLVRLQEIPAAPAWLRGQFCCRGSIVPVVDLSVLSGQAPCAARLSTRILIVNRPEGRVGLLAEGVTDAVRRGDEEPASPGHRVRLDALLPREALRHLFPAGPRTPSAAS